MRSPFRSAGIFLKAAFFP